jgi:hypothetical protein
MVPAAIPSPVMSWSRVTARRVGWRSSRVGKNGSGARACRQQNAAVAARHSPAHPRTWTDAQAN